MTTAKPGAPRVTLAVDTTRNPWRSYWPSLKREAFDRARATLADLGAPTEDIEAIATDAWISLTTKYPDPSLIKGGDEGRKKLIRTIARNRARTAARAARRRRKREQAIGEEPQVRRERHATLDKLRAAVLFECRERLRVLVGDDLEFADTLLFMRLFVDDKTSADIRLPRHDGEIEQALEGLRSRLGELARFCAEHSPSKDPRLKVLRAMVVAGIRADDPTRLSHLKPWDTRRRLVAVCLPTWPAWFFFPKPGEPMSWRHITGAPRWNELAAISIALLGNFPTTQMRGLLSRRGGVSTGEAIAAEERLLSRAAQLMGCPLPGSERLEPDHE